VKLLVPVSYFRGKPRSELWLLDTALKNQVLWRTLPASPITVRGKGVTGICVHPAGGYALCDFNRVLHLCSNGFTVHEKRREDFNDLHAITATDHGFLLTNTGRDQVEQLRDDFSLADKFDALNAAEADERLSGKCLIGGEYYDEPDSELAFCEQRLADKLHLNHSLLLPDGRVVASSMAKCCYLDAQCFTPISNRLHYPMHDGLMYRDRLWVTTVNGEVLAAQPNLHLDFQPVVDLAASVPWRGWCRGLYIAEDRLFVGVTAIASRSQRTSWLDVDPCDTRTGVYEFCLSTLRPLHFYNLSHPDGARVFSMTEWLPCLR
jgi:hypothetical protein